MENIKMCLKYIFDLSYFPEFLSQPESGPPASAMLHKPGCSWTMRAPVTASVAASVAASASLLITATIPQEKPLPGSRPQNPPS